MRDLLNLTIKLDLFHIKPRVIISMSFSFVFILSLQWEGEIINSGHIKPDYLTRFVLHKTKRGYISFVQFRFRLRQRASMKSSIRRIRDSLDQTIKPESFYIKPWVVISVWFSFLQASTAREILFGR